MKGFVAIIHFRKKGVFMAFEYAIVLTGGIATGKSTVLKFFISEGFDVIDADKIAHQMLDKHHEAIATLFGREYVINKRVERKALGALIFSRPKEKLRLEQLLHPLIHREIERLAIEKDRFKKPYIVDIPLFFESNGRYPISKSIVVYAPQEKQLERLIKRDGSNTREAQQRIDAQISIEKKRDWATFLIDNSKDLENLEKECIKVRKQI